MIVKLKCQIQVNQNVSKFYRVKNDFPYHQYKMRLVFFVVFICNRNLLNFFNWENVHSFFCGFEKEQKLQVENMVDEYKLNQFLLLARSYDIHFPLTRSYDSDQMKTF